MIINPYIRGTLKLLDTFNRSQVGLGVADSGQTYTVLGDPLYTLVGGVAACSSFSTNPGASVIDSGASDGVIHLKLVEQGYQAGISFRSSGATTMYMQSYTVSANTRNMNIGYYDGAAFNSLTTFFLAAASFEVHTLPIEFWLTLSGTSISLDYNFNGGGRVNAGSLISAQNQTATRHGLFEQNSGIPAARNDFLEMN